MTERDTNDMAELMAQFVNMMNSHPVAKRGTKPAKHKYSDAERQAKVDENTAECIQKFTAAGYKDVRPRENVLMAKHWRGRGRLIKKGEKAISVGPFALFHIDQTEPIVSEATLKMEVEQMAEEQANDPVDNVSTMAPPQDKKLHWTDWNK